MHFADYAAQRSLHLGQRLCHATDLVFAVEHALRNLGREITGCDRVELMDRSLQRIRDIFRDQNGRCNADRQPDEDNREEDLDGRRVGLAALLIELLTGEHVARRDRAQVIRYSLDFEYGLLDLQTLFRRTAEFRDILDDRIRILGIGSEFIEALCHLRIRVDFLQFLDIRIHSAEIGVDFLGEHLVVHLARIGEQQIGRIDIDGTETRINVIDVLRRDDILLVNFLYRIVGAAVEKYANARNQNGDKDHNGREGQDFCAYGKIFHDSFPLLTSGTGSRCLS